jgi:homoserine kinase
VSASDPVRFTVRAPANSGNLGAGFDCLALALDLWNETTIELGGEGIEVQLAGEFTQHIPADETNLIVHTMLRRLRELHVPRPAGMRVTCVNGVPPNSGLGSSSVALAIGVLAADTIAGRAPDPVALMRWVGAIEGHVENAAATAFGGLVLVSGAADDFQWRSFPVPELRAVIATPPPHYSTRQARALLPQAVPLADAVFNMGRMPLIIEALRTGDLDMLRNVVADRLHQRYRLALTPGAEEALQAAWEAGAAGAFVSGSGPTLLAFVRDDDEARMVGEAMLEEFKVAEVQARVRVVTTTNEAAAVIPLSAPAGG